MAVPDSPSPRLPALRISDADRDAAVRDLRHHYTDGRLTLEDFLDRLPRALSARTGADLDPLFVDLPAAAAAPPRNPARRRRFTPPRRVLVAAVAAGAFAAGAVAATGWTTSPAPPTQTALFRYHCAQCVNAVGQDQAQPGAAQLEYDRLVGHPPNGTTR